MPDAQQVYDEAGDNRRDLLARVWPDLNAALRVAHEQASSNRIILCTLSHNEPPRPEATGRLTLNGHAACPQHLKGSSRRGGFPLQRVDPRTWTP